MSNKLTKQNGIAQRVVTFLNRKEVDFLDGLGKDALFSTGIKLSRAKLICWLVDFLEKLHINGEGIKSEEDFDNRILEVLGQTGSVRILKNNPKTSHGRLNQAHPKEKTLGCANTL